MKFSIKILFAVLLLPAFASAQSNYKPGYVVTVKGDTLRGFIDYRGWDLNPRVIKFKSPEEGKSGKFTVRDIKYFNIDKIASYCKFTGLISMDNTDPDHMIEYRDTTYKLDSVFLQVLEKGKNVALYSYSDAIKTRCFIGENPDFTPVELVYRLYYDLDHADLVTNKGRTVYENGYMKTFFLLSVKYHVDSERFKNDLTEYGYKEYYLAQLVRKINEGSK